MDQTPEIIFEVTLSEAENIVKGTQKFLFTTYSKCYEEGVQETTAYLFSHYRGVFGKCILNKQRRALATSRRSLEVQGAGVLLQGFGEIAGYVWDIKEFSAFKKPLKLSDLKIKDISGEWQYL